MKLMKKSVKKVGANVRTNVAGPMKVKKFDQDVTKPMTTRSR